MRINDVLFKIRSSGEKAFKLAYVRSTGKTAGSIGSGEFIFMDYMDTNTDEIKLKDIDADRIKTLKISHIISFNKIIIKR